MGQQHRQGMLGMGWVLSMAVVEGLSAEAVADRLEAELGGIFADKAAPYRAQQAQAGSQAHRSSLRLR
jgi:hypothetical protein